MQYKFRKLTKDGPDDVSFEATDFLHALQQASNRWFGCAKVVDYQRSVSAITLLGHAGAGEGNVIGTIYDLT
jgi:hypothetical protein